MKLQNLVMIAGLTLSVASLSACASSMSESDAPSSSNASNAQANAKKPTGPATKPQYRAEGEGTNYEWGKDHIFVKLSNAESGGVLTLVQDNLKPGFDLGLHLHKTHTEIFYILDGEVDFIIGEKAHTVTTGSVVYVPAGIPHAAKSSKGGRMLMFFAPGGFDDMLAEINASSWFQRFNPFATARRNEKYDIHKTSDGTLTNSSGPKPLVLAAGEGENIQSGTGTGVIKLSSEQTDGLAFVTEENLEPGSERASQLPGNQSETIYILQGDVQFEGAEKMITASEGATIYFPPGVASNVKATGSAKILVYRTPGGVTKN
jgi:quercetin dioxygenase-like cupin family protein